MDALVAVVPHERLDVAALGLLGVVLHRQRSDPMLLERECLERFELRALDVEADEVDQFGCLRVLQDGLESRCRELDRWRGSK